MQPDLKTVSLSDYLDRAASGEPVPGGGSVAAVSGALAASMASMVCAFTLSSKKLAESHEEAAVLRETSEQARAELSALAQADIDAYAQVSAAYALPKTTDTEKQLRKERIAAACSCALQPPLETMRALSKLSGTLPRLCRIGNLNLVSDIGVSAQLCLASCESALLNVEVNLPFLPEETRERTLCEAEDLLQKVTVECSEALALVDRIIHPES